MATIDLDITGFLQPDPGSSTGPFWENSEVLDSNDLYAHPVLAFPETGTKIAAFAAFEIPQNYVGTPVFVVKVRTAATSGNLVTDVDYTSIADGETGDPAAHQASLTATTAVPGTARLLKTITHAATGSHFAAGDTCFVSIARDMADAADSISSTTVYVEKVLFRYADA